MRKRIIKFTLKAIITLGFVSWIVFNTNWPEVLYYLKKIEWWQIVLYIILLLAGNLICSYRWKILAKFKDIDVSLKDLFKFYLAGTFINNFMPSFIAGDAFKAYAIAGEKRKYTEAASSVMMDRITGLIGAMLLALAFSIINIKTVLSSGILIFINILTIISLFSDVLIARLKKIPLLKRWVYKFLPEKIIKFLRELYSYSDNYRIIKKTVGLSMLFAIVSVALQNYILFWALGVKISALNYLSVIFLTSIISAVPITINNIGLKEWSYITFFGIFGVTSSAVVAISVISRFLQMFVSFFALPIYLRSKDIYKS